MQPTKEKAKKLCALRWTVGLLTSKTCLGNHAVEGTGNIKQRIAYYMRVTLSGFDAFMSKQLLHVPDITPLFQQMGGKTMAKHVHVNLTLNAC